MIWSGDELAQPNDPGWASEEGHEEDNRWAHRPRLDWTRAAARHDLRTVPGRVFSGLAHLARVRAGLPQLHASAATTVLPDTDDGVLAVVRQHASGAFVGLYNVSGRRRPFHAAPAARGRPHHAVRRPRRARPRGRRRRRPLAPGVRRLVGRGRAAASGSLDAQGAPVPSVHVIRFEKVSKAYPGTGKPALDQVSIDIEKGEFVFLVGQSGSGKVDRAAAGAPRDPVDRWPRARRRQGPQPARRLEGAAAAPPDRHRVPGLPAAAQQDRLGERRVRAPGDRQVPRRDPARWCRRPSSWSASTARASGCPTSSPAASSSGSRSRAPSSTGR